MYNDSSSNRLYKWMLNKFEQTFEDGSRYMSTFKDGSTWNRRCMLTFKDGSTWNHCGLLKTVPHEAVVICEFLKKIVF